MDRATILRVAAESETDPRTVRALAMGKPVRPAMRERIERAMKKLRVQL
jgi:DNA-binding LacI/PurR family transcriptional regulator